MGIVDDLQRLVPAIENAHCDRHPILGQPETKHLPQLLLQRLQGQLADVGRLAPSIAANILAPLLLPPNNGRLNEQLMVALTARAAEGTGPGNTSGVTRHGPSVRVVSTTDDDHRVPRVPQMLLFVFGQLVDDQRFLKRLVAFGRQRLLTALLQGGPSAVNVECPVPGAPTVVCRVRSRPHMDWKHTFRTLFPRRYHEERNNNQPPNGVGRLFTYQSRITFSK